MGSFLGSLVSGASSLIGGLFGQQNQAQINQANINNQDFLASGGETVAMANSLRAAGINPAAASGALSPASAVVGQSSNAVGQGVAQAGSDIGGALTDYMDKNSKTAALNTQLLQAQVDKAQQDVVAGQLHNSVIARNLAAPGKLPTMKPDGSRANPIPASAYYRGANGEVFAGPSREYADTQFGPAAWLTGTEQLVSQGVRQARDTASWASDYLLRPDVVRGVENVEGPVGGYNP